VRGTLILLASLLFLALLRVRTQDTSSTIGAVMDSTGSGVRKGTSSAAFARKGFVRHLVSDVAGEYSVSPIAVRSYVYIIERRDL
jgi:hypothetical protein